MSVIATKELSKEYQSRTFSKEKILALNNFTFEVNEGEIFGILGPNGAGKTTLIKILLGITFRTKGNVQIFGKEIDDTSYKFQTGYLPENHRFPSYLTGEQALAFYGKLGGMNSVDVKKKTDEYLRIVDMDSWRKTKIKKYSKGMLQRLGLAQALMNDPKLVFLDEPTDGVDPIGRKQIRDLLTRLRESGKTIFLNSHLLSEVELICDRVAILNKGGLVASGSVEELTSVADSYRFSVSAIADDLMQPLLNTYKAVIKGPNEFTYKAGTAEELNGLIDFLRQKKAMILQIEKEKNTLENMFINLIGSQD
ncbi:MAG: ABC transporter ATP-binding protein [Ignavibacteria bacterium]|nr:ABC transporter ATP-binding protein [Ignavibacteria bacterium]